MAADGSPWISDLEWQREPQQARSRATRDALLDAVEQLLGTKTVDELTLADVAEQAGCSVGSVYHHFKNKQALVYAMLDRLADETLATIEAAADPDRWEGASIEDVIRGYLEFALGFARATPGVARAKLRLALEDPAVDAQLRDVGAALDKRLTELFAARRAEIGHPDPDTAIAFVLDPLAAELRARVELPGIQHNLVAGDAAFVDQAVASAAAYLRLASP